jgi:hypothetical protein
MTQPVQLVIAATEQDFVTLQPGDEVWSPAFGTTEEPRYLGPASLPR